MELQEKYARAMQELGKAKEWEFKAKLEERYGIKLDIHVKKAGYEFDLVGYKKGKPWVFEVKWKGKPASLKELENFAKKARKAFGEKARLFYISKTGFTDKAREVASNLGITLIEFI